MPSRLRTSALSVCATLLAACSSLRSRPAAELVEKIDVGQVLDDWHSAAASADAERYFGHMDAEAVFLGTDATERWTLSEFRAYCEPYFSKGVGWTYEPRERHVAVDGKLAWFDERLWNQKYGECRGSGVLRKRDDEWKIVHYNLTIPVPNELAAKVVELIRAR